MHLPKSRANQKLTLNKEIVMIVSVLILVMMLGLTTVAMLAVVMSALTILAMMAMGSNSVSLVELGGSMLRKVRYRLN